MRSERPADSCFAATGRRAIQGCGLTSLWITAVIWLVVSAPPVWAQSVLDADPLDRLDPARFGPGTLIAAMEALEGYRPAQAIQPVRALMFHADPDVARTAGWLLRRMDDGGASAQVAAGVLGDAQRSVEARTSAALALGELRSGLGSGALRAALATDPQAGVRRQSALTLGRLHRPGSAPALAAALSADEDATVRQAAARALGRVPDGDASALVAALADPDAFVRLEATWALGRMRASAATGNLIRSLQTDPDCRVRAAAAWALGEVGDPSAADALGAAQQSDCRLAAQAAVYTLGHLED